MEILNKAELVGEVVDVKESHEFMGEKFLEVVVAINRNSGVKDILPVIVSDRITPPLNAGECVSITGSFRSRNKLVGSKTKLILNVFASDIKITEQTKHVNLIEINAFLCKAPNYRKTPLGREVTDLVLACNRYMNNTDYIPAIAWGRNAIYSSKLEVGTALTVTGRVQSRQYQKMIGNELVDMTAYELSIVTICDKKGDEE